ncbi:NAD(P)/FAD-dependent oxidoreductase [Clostridium culturomicium]|uniref:NAD(P)/FAD-dependent oxidoreductase n=1 Tax=Clostridium culturomicium TaxID=1499683 RepID=UPI0038573DE7
MASLKKLNKTLNKLYGESVSASYKEDVITLIGELDKWEDVVKAGLLAASGHYGSHVVNNIQCTSIEKQKMRMPALKDESLEGKKYDVVIIGAGIVGCAIARELSRWDLKILLLDKEHDVALHGSSRNDGMIHPGIDLKKGQIKQKYNALGNKMYDKVSKELDVPFKRTGQYLGFKKEWYSFMLPLATRYWRSMNVPCEYIGREELFKREPNLSKDIQCALYFPTAGIICPYGITIAYAENAVDNGVKLSLDTAVLNMEVGDGVIRSVSTNRGTIYPRVVVNAAGVFSEEIAKLAKDHFFSIHPRKGTNSILDKKAAFQVRTIASLIGTQATTTTHTKGGGIVSTIDHNLLIGPDAVETFEKENFSTNAESINNTFEKQRAASPSLKTSDIITYFTGIRAATYEEDFVLQKGKFTKNIVHAAGIQSPGLTAAPAIGVDIAKYTVELLMEEGSVKENPNFNPYRKGIPDLSEMSLKERDAFIKSNPDFGSIVCRCEEVSKGEILAALNRSVPCDSVDGVKRRVRPGMGRCQGSFCGPLVAKLIAQAKGIPLKEVIKNGEGSNIVFGDTKEAWAKDGE